MGRQAFTSPSYNTPSPVSSLSPISRGAKRTRSRTFSSHDELSADDLAAFRNRGLSTASSYLPTPPLSASSSVSSASSSTSSLGGGGQHFPSFGSFQWRPESAGPPMCTASPENYAAAPDADFEHRPAHLSFQLVHPPSARVFNDRPLSASQGMLPTPIPIDAPAARVLARHNDVQHSILPPKAPTLEEQHIDVNPLLDGLKPWLQQEYVEGLIGVSMLAIESIWPLQSAAQKGKASPDTPPGSPDQVLPLKYFIQETLRRSRSSAIVLQVALYYLHKSRSRIRDRVAKAELAKDRFSHLAKLRSQSQQTAYPSPPASPLLDDFTAAAADVLATSKDPVICGRRMFLAALISASKFLLDRTYSNRAWSRLSGLPVSEINANERAFLSLLDYRLYISTDLMANWMTRLRKLQEQQGIIPPSPIARKGLERTQSENLASLQLPMQELKASFHLDSASPAAPTPISMPNIVRSQSHATALPSSFPDIDLNPRLGQHVSKPPIQRTATLGLSRSSSLSRGVGAHDFASSPLRWSLPSSAGGRSCSVSSGLGPSERPMAVHAY